jgi:hypothetical protein
LWKRKGLHNVVDIGDGGVSKGPEHFLDEGKHFLLFLASVTLLVYKF